MLYSSTVEAGGSRATDGLPTSPSAYRIAEVGNGKYGSTRWNDARQGREVRRCMETAGVQPQNCCTSRPSPVFCFAGRVNGSHHMVELVAVSRAGVKSLSAVVTPEKSCAQQVRIVRVQRKTPCESNALMLHAVADNAPAFGNDRNIRWRPTESHRLEYVALFVVVVHIHRQQ